jgi:hypothetical protein
MATTQANVNVNASLAPPGAPGANSGVPYASWQLRKPKARLSAAHLIGQGDVLPRTLESYDNPVGVRTFQDRVKSRAPEQLLEVPKGRTTLAPKGRTPTEYQKMKKKSKSGLDGSIHKKRIKLFRILEPKQKNNVVTAVGYGYDEGYWRRADMIKQGPRKRPGASEGQTPSEQA